MEEGIVLGKKKGRRKEGEEEEEGIVLGKRRNQKRKKKEKGKRDRIEK